MKDIYHEIFQWQFCECCQKSSMFGFQKDLLPPGLTRRKLIFSQLLLWVSRKAWVQIWIWKGEIKRGGNPIKERPSPESGMNEWEIDPEAAVYSRWGRGLLTDMATGVGDQEIWKKYWGNTKCLIKQMLKVENTKGEMDNKLYFPVVIQQQWRL